MNNPIDFSKRSRRAIFIFVIVLCVIVLIPRTISLFSANEEYVIEQTEWEKKKFKKYTFKKYPKRNYFKFNKKSKFKTPPKKFDPNTYLANDWMNLGLSEKQANLVVSFGKRGFYSDQDLKKVFVISEKFFQVIKDSLYYPTKPTSFAKSEYKKPSEKPKIEINTATEEDLLNLKGIGPFFAKNILKKRNELGGFINNEQLLEIWKMDQEKLDLIQNAITINANLIQKISLNSASVEDLKKHPYIRWNIANSIVKIREQLGGFQSIEDIKRSVLIDESTYNKLKPYLTL